jgi:hypothetical protein
MIFEFMAYALIGGAGAWIFWNTVFKVVSLIHKWIEGKMYSIELVGGKFDGMVIDLEQLFDQYSVPDGPKYCVYKRRDRSYYYDYEGQRENINETQPSY